MAERIQYEPAEASIRTEGLTKLGLAKWHEPTKRWRVIAEYGEGRSAYQYKRMSTAIAKRLAAHEAMHRAEEGQ